jgi:hypothetical protein
MPTYLAQWPNGLLSIATADDMKDLSLELAKDEVCTEREKVKSEWDSPHGLIIELPKGFHLHFEFTDEVDLLFHELPRDAMPTIERLFPHLAQVMKVGHTTKKAARAAAKEAMVKERQGLK